MHSIESMDSESKQYTVKRPCCVTESIK